jgi:HNH endonuclease
MAWIVAYGPIPEGLQVLHRCDVRNCIEPTHLFLGTNADNMADKVAKGRQSHPQGENHGGVKLTEAQVREIRAPPFSMSQRAIAALYGVDKSVISRIRTGKLWAHLASAPAPDA